MTHVLRMDNFFFITNCKRNLNQSVMYFYSFGQTSSTNNNRIPLFLLFLTLLPREYFFNLFDSLFKPFCSHSPQILQNSNFLMKSTAHIPAYY